MRIIRVLGCHECPYSEGYRHDTLYICNLLSTAYNNDDVTIDYENETLPEDKCPLEKEQLSHKEWMNKQPHDVEEFYKD